ncbi:MAG: hypothetical protein MN733_22240, partial [Nitrososphaera sp.]|nr:hypothetical protein [Nitrososphaera sp.]
DPSINKTFLKFAYGNIYNAILKEWQENANALTCSTYHIENTEGAKEEVSFQNATTISLNRLPCEEEIATLAEFLPQSSGFAKLGKSIPSGWNSPDVEMEKNEVIEKVDSILDTLPPEDKDIVYRRMFQGESFDHIAEIKGESYRHIHYRYYRILESLRDKMVEAGLEDYA